MEPQNCYICDNSSMFYCKNIFKISSKHSETLISEFIVRFLGKETNRLCDEDNIVCSECLDKIDEYDLACMTVERVERELRAALLHTEAVYGGDPVFVEIDDMEEDDDVECGKMPLLEIELALDDAIPSQQMGDTVKRSTDHQHTVTDARISDAPKVTSKAGNITKARNQPTAIVERRSKPKAMLKAITVTFKCSQCNDKFETKSDLKQHEKIHAQPEMFTCEVCGLATKTAAGLTRHKQLHTNGEPFECAICQKVFKKKNSLARHMRIHTGEKFYQCDKCGVEFIHKSSFRMHIMAHDDIREKKCPHCTQSFRSTSHLNRHLRIHTGAKPYGCPDCGQKFAQRYNMMVHLRIHKGISRNVDKTHVCSICNIAFVRAQKLTEHYRKAHETIPHTTISGGTSATSASTAASTSIVVEQMT